MFRGLQGRRAILGDALGVLYVVVKFRARGSILNDIAGEIALLMAPKDQDLRAAHFWTQKNTICDYMGRLGGGGQPVIEPRRRAFRVCR